MDSINGISYYLNKMLDAIKHITDYNFFFQEDSAQVHIVCVTQSNWVKMWLLHFPVLPGIMQKHKLLKVA